MSLQYASSSLSGMYRILSLIALLACLPASAFADPIHARADGAYWHHESGWVFPEKVGEFVRVGIPQDVAGSQDAVAYYACEVGGARNTASVDVYLAKSAAAAELETPPEDRLTSEGTLPLGATQAVAGTRRIYAAGTGTEGFVGVYFVSAGDWRVRIRITGSELSAMDAFVRGQRWETLGSH
jgi:hypothetical protein